METFTKMITSLSETVDTIFGWSQVNSATRAAGALTIIGLSSWWIASTRRINANKRKMAKKQRLFREKRDRLYNELIPQQNPDVMDPDKEAILSLSVNDLLAGLKSGNMDPVAVLEAYQAKAVLASISTNCICDFIDEARTQAENLRKVPVDERGPLFGLPISLKECFYVKGYDCTAGMARYIDHPHSRDGALVARIKELGAVPFCLTNVPQTMLSYACSNPVYGETVNPWDKTRTPGGSSGGEACLIAMGGSILGLGSDVGGSLRIPSHFCGISALKPTSGRIVERGRRRGRTPGVSSNAGFMCKTVDGVVLGMKVLLEDADAMAREDFCVAPLNWRHDLYMPGRKLKIGWYVDDGFLVPAVPSCKRAVSEAVKMLESAGHHIVHFQPPHLKEFVQDFFEFMLADLGQNALEVWKDEVLDQSICVNNLVYKIPFCLRSTLFKYFFDLTSPSMAKVAAAGLNNAAHLMKGLEECEARREAHLRAWVEAEIDVVIAPGFTTQAQPLKDPARLVPATCFTSVYNVIDFPVGTVPVDVVTQSDQDDMQSYPGYRQDVLCGLIKDGGSSGTVGLPLNVQVVGRPWQEELVLHVMETLEELAEFKTKFKPSP